MRWLVGALIALHGLIHLLGFLKAFGLHDPPQLTRAITPAWGVAWLVAALAVLASAVLLATGARGAWLLGGFALLLSQVLIFSAWQDAKFGSLANLLLLGWVAYAFATHGPLSLQAQYRSALTRTLAQVSGLAAIREADLGELPEPVARYLQVSGAVGQPRVSHFQARTRGRIRGGPDEPWMEFTAEQHNLVDPPTRLFLMRAWRAGLPVDVYHAFVDGSARMRVRLVSLWPLVDARGPQMTRAETVTLFNDMAVFAPGSLLDRSIRWEPIDAHSARGHYTCGRETVSAVLHFDDTGDLTDFVSDDRSRGSADGRSFTPQRWSTPLRQPRQFGPLRIAARGEARWHPTNAESFAYLEIHMLDVKVQ